MKILLTGATGFVGQRLVDHLLKTTSFFLQLAVRSRPRQSDHPRIGLSMIADISASTDWSSALSECDVVIHVAARAHVMDNNNAKSLDLYRTTNTDGTLNLARQAMSAGVKRFIFISTIKVNGESSRPGLPIDVDDMEPLNCPYAISKYEAEQGLLALSSKNQMEIVIIRPVLIYGPGVKGNFQQMIKWLNKGLPLPLAIGRNQRSFVSIDNLVDLIATCITHLGAANQIFLVSDNHDLSTNELLKKLYHHLNKRSLLLPVPIWLLKRIAQLVGKTSVIEKLYGTLQVDIRKTQELLGWKPVTTVDDAIRLMIEKT